MPDRILDASTYRLLYTVALALGGTALLLALWSFHRSMPRAARMSRAGAAALAAAAIAALAFAALSTIERGVIGHEGFDAVEYLRRLGLSFAFALAFTLGVGLAVGVVLAARALQQRPLAGAASVFATAAPAALVAVGVVALVLAMSSQLTRIGRYHPPNTVFGNEHEADRLAGAQFATDLAVAPTGEIFVAEHFTGQINVLVPDGDGDFTSEPFGTVPLPEDGRLLHIALHPEWPAMPYLYASAHEGSGRDQRMSVFRLHAAGLSADQVEPIVRGLPTEDPTRGAKADHLGGALAACGEYLYLSVGDTDSPGPGSFRPGNIRARAQMPGQAEGKILRYSFDGADLVPAVPSGANPPVFAMGFRNPFSIECGAEAGHVVVGDNGYVGRDQIRDATLNSNHEWPLSDARDAFTPPIFDSGPTSALAPTGVATHEVAGVTQIWFSSFHLRAIYRLLLDDSGQHADRVEVVHAAEDAILSMTDGPDGCLYFTTPNAVWRVRDDGCTSSATVVPTLETFESAEPFFLANCAPCHGIHRDGGVGPSLLPDRLIEVDDYYTRRILEGVGNRMPAWSDAGLTEEQARALVEYLRTEP